MNRVLNGTVPGIFVVTGSLNRGNYIAFFIFDKYDKIMKQYRTSTCTTLYVCIAMSKFCALNRIGANCNINIMCLMSNMGTWITT